MRDIRITEEEISQALIDRHTEEVQARIRAARVAVAGLGGLGSNIAVSLARIGVGHLHLIDFDRVDVTNLNRQQYFADQVGMYKTEALRENLLRINPWLELRTDCLRVTEENAAELLRDDAYICEAFDIAENKAMLAGEVLEHFPEKYLVAASGMAGYGDSNEIRTRRVTSHFYLCGDEKTEAEAGRGLMAPRVALCAAHQANMVLRLILGER
ncbi:MULTISPECIES: sulfur carrier protein ThiS adenylyltransferase ThiF [Clostridia]|uniref:Sulfur carrier protein ThiS adenylyltransferase ThiF n=1 Tax=Faecalicatena fissicatena TaxID=290055 RepID=A0ABS2EB72_9FIRM|nr:MULTISPECIES: sulfur carrier protein ThiS adenylyltransferase ThiF [Clostridia]MBM6738870.1 sulfur carrier protein ThiS adenylyltransferase ThiF [Faecalicatena fissicatena]HIX99533.1 sulfur carrier protein ThiS adenylyltransferase ThiF [Candidatus Dorea intestinigallinarum]